MNSDECMDTLTAAYIEAKKEEEDRLCMPLKEGVRFMTYSKETGRVDVVRSAGGERRLVSYFFELDGDGTWLSQGVRFDEAVE